MAVSSHRGIERVIAVAWPVAVVAMVAVAALAATYMTVEKPLFAALGVIAAALGLTALASPELATLTAVFILYSNVAVVAVRFHGVPKVAGQAVVLLLLIPLIHHTVLRRRRLVIHPALALMVVFGMVQVLGFLFSRDPATAGAAIVEYAIEGVLVFFLVTNVVRTPAALRHVTWALMLAGVVMSAVPLYQQLTHDFDNVYGGFGQTTELGFRTGEVTDTGTEVRQARLSGTIGEQNRFAQNMLMLVPLGLVLVWSERRRGLRLLALGLTGFAAVGCMLAFSRGAAVAFVLLLGVMLLMRIVTLRQLIPVALGALVLLAAMPQYWKRLSSMQNIPSLFSGDVTNESNPDGAIRGRVTEMLAAGMVYVDHPVVGVGPGMFKYYSREYGNRLGIRRLEGNRESHSLFLGIAAETGTIGLGCFLGFVGITMLGLLRARRSCVGEDDELAAQATGYFLAIVAYLASGIFLHMAYARFFYLVLGLGAAAAVIAEARVRVARDADNP